MRKPFVTPYYGWAVLAAGAVTEMLAQGSTSYAAGLFVLPLQAEFHLSRANANSSVLILFLGAALMAPLAGRALDRFSARIVLSLGALALCLAFTAIAFTGSLWVMAAALFVFGAIAFMTLGPLTTATLASRWFYRRRGFALGLAAVATSGGGLVVVPFLSAAIQAHGWRLALFYEGLVILVIVLALAALVIRDNPRDLGLENHPENQGRAGSDAPAADAATGVAAAPPRWRSILSRRAFWIPSLALASISGTCQGIVVTLVPYGVQLGYGAPRSALMISMFSTGAAVTKVAAGLLADHVPNRILLMAGSGCMIAAMLLLCFFQSYAALSAAAVLSGVSLGFALPIAAAMIATAFGSAAFGGVMGWTYALILGMAIWASRFIGGVFDATGGYVLGFATFLAIAVIVLAAIAFLGPRPAAARA